MTSTVLPRAREYLKSQPAGSNAAFCRADGKRLPFRDGSFDLVVCLYGLHHFRGYLDALKEISRVLKPTGKFALIDPIRRADKSAGGPRGTEVLTLAELWRMLDEAGFEIVSSRISFGAMRAVMRSRETRD
jgi:SAM-dependent methyltransferase